MKQFSLLAALLLCLTVFAQKRQPVNVPVVSNANILDNRNNVIDANHLFKGQTIHFGFNILNPSQSDAIKAGTCSLEIELGDKLQTAPNASAKISLNDYFSWSTTTDENGKTLLNGKFK